MRSAYLTLLLICALLWTVVPATATINASPVGSHSIVITQFFVTGGSTNSPYTYNFIELFNAGPVPINLFDFTLQYQTATGSMGPTNSFFLGPNSSYTTGGITYPATTTFSYNNGFNGVLQPGQYLLIQTPSQGSIAPGDLPLTPDIVLGKSLNGTNAGKPSTSGGKYAVLATTSSPYCGTNSTNPARTNTTTDPYHVLIGPMATDFVGYRSDSGSNPNCYEGNGPVYTKPDASVSSSKANVAGVRSFTNGCPVDTNNNGNMDTSTTPPTFSAADFAMIKIGPGVTNGWQLHNSTSVITNGDPSTITPYTPTMCPLSANTANPMVEVFASRADDPALTPVTKIEAGADTQLLLNVIVTDGGINPTSAMGYRMTADLSGLGAALRENSLAAAPQKFGFLGLDASFGNPQYQFPIPPENPAPTTPPSPVTFTLSPAQADQGTTFTIPVTILDDAQRQITTNVTLEVVGSTPGAASLTAVPASVPASIATPVQFTARITDYGVYPQATSFTVTMDFSEIGGTVATCPAVADGVYTCDTTVTADMSKVGGNYTIPVTVVDDQGRTLTLTPTAIQLPVTGTPEPVANLTWATPSTGDFGNIVQGATSNPQTATLTNTGLAALSITSIAASGDFAATSNCPTALDPTKSCAISITFTPTSVGARAGILTVTDDSHAVAGSLQTLSLTGSGTPPPATADLSSAALSFGNQIVTTPSATQTLTLTNNGGQLLSVSGIALTGNDKSDFSYVTNCGASLGVGASCTFTFTFKPAAAGNKTASLVLNDTASNSPQTVQLSGAGVDFPIGPAANGSTTATIAAGQTAIYNLQVSPAGPFKGTVTIACATVIQGATCKADPASVNVDGSSVPFALSITTSARNTEVAKNDAAPIFVGGQSGPGSNSHTPMRAILLLALASVVVPFTSRRARKRWASIATCAVLLCVMGMSACADLKTSPWPQQPAVSTPAGTYAVTVTATYGTVVRTTTLTLKVN